MQSAQPCHPIRAGAEHKVIGIAQYNVCAGRPHIFGAHGLYRGPRADGHKGRRADISALHFDKPGARFAVGSADRKFESLGHSLLFSLHP